jgi:hypothetical protein
VQACSTLHVTATEALQEGEIATAVMCCMSGAVVSHEKLCVFLDCAAHYAAGAQVSEVAACAEVPGCVMIAAYSMRGPVAAAACRMKDSE